MDNIFDFLKIFMALLSIFINILTLKNMKRVTLLHKRVLNYNSDLF